MTSTTSQLQAQHINIKELKASEFNPQTWSDHQLAKLRESIEKFGVVDPLIINPHPSRKNIVIGGNMWLQVLKELKYTGLFCEARTVLESTLEQVMFTAINQALCEKDQFLITLQKNI